MTFFKSSMNYYALIRYTIDVESVHINYIIWEISVAKKDLHINHSYKCNWLHNNYWLSRLLILKNTAIVKEPPKQNQRNISNWLKRPSRSKLSLLSRPLIHQNKTMRTDHQNFPPIDIRSHILQISSSTKTSWKSSSRTW